MLNRKELLREQITYAFKVVVQLLAGSLTGILVSLLIVNSPLFYFYNSLFPSDIGLRFNDLGRVLDVFFFTLPFGTPIGTNLIGLLLFGKTLWLRTYIIIFVLALTFYLVGLRMDSHAAIILGFALPVLIATIAFHYRK